MKIYAATYTEYDGQLERTKYFLDKNNRDKAVKKMGDSFAYKSEWSLEKEFESQIRSMKLDKKIIVKLRVEK